MKVKTNELNDAQQVINVRMRDDLAEMGLLIPASKTFEGYDNMVDDIVVSAEELEGAIEIVFPALLELLPLLFTETFA